ncbi:MAG: hypothetical protein ACOVLH_15430 [Roseateles sp.]
MHDAVLRITLTLAASLMSSLSAQAQQARGVNPADIDSRFDLIVKHVALEPEGRSQSLILKYDYKLDARWGLNFELPVYSRLSQPGFARSGQGDLFARARWVVPEGHWTYGAAAEAVLPTASDDVLGTGRYQLNASVMAVRVFSPSFLGAVAVKQTSSLGGDASRARFSNTDIRLVPVLILPQGWAAVLELRQTWEHRGAQARWQRAELMLNKQLDPHWAGSLSLGRDFGDRRDDGALALALKYFF